jgi:hypothetical protein
MLLYLGGGEPRLRFPAGICRNPVIPFFPKLLERNRDSSPAGKHSGALPGIRSAWASVEIYVGYKTSLCPIFALTSLLTI